MKVFCVYDCKVESYGSPFFYKTKGDALRSFSEVANDTKTQIGKYPADFTLFELGDYFEENAKFSIHATPIAIAVAVEFVKEMPVNHVNDDPRQVALVS